MNKWLDECWRLGVTIAIAVVFGLLAGHVLLVLALALLGYCGWMIYRLAELESWLQRGAKTADTPDTVGLASTVAQLVHRESKKRQREKKKLKNTLQQFNALAVELPDATVVLDEKLQITWCNPAAETLFGLSYKRDRGQRIDNLIRLPEFHQFLSGEDTREDFELVSPVNPAITTLLTCVPAGRKLQILTGRNITQRVQIREMRKAFVADVSHELRTPLTVIEGHIELLRDEQDIPEELQLPLLRVAEQTDRMTKIVGDLLTLSKLESNLLTDVQGVRISMSTMINSIVESALITSSNSHPIDLQITESIEVRGIESELHSAIQNLILNAIAYTDPGTLIEIHWDYTSDDIHDNRSANFSVIDHGDGIEPEHVPKLSQRFFRVDKARSRESGGTGLGLAIVKYIAQRHGGQLEISSVVGKGSTFTINLPPSRVMDTENLASEVQPEYLTGSNPQ